MIDKLGRVNWEMGQTLLPEHLIAQEESLAAEAALRFRTRGLPDYGVARLIWSDALLLQGVFAIQSMVLILRSGQLLSVRENATVSPFNLNVSGSVEVPVYCHLIEGGENAEDPDKAGSSGGESNGVVKRIKRHLVLSNEQTHREAVETIKLAEFLKTPEGEWKLAPGYVPPLLQVGSSPFLRSDLEELNQSLDAFQKKLSQELAVSYLSGDTMFAAKQCMKWTITIKRLTANLLAQVHLHPYFAYEDLKRFYMEVCFYQETMPEFMDDAYDHDRLGECFQRIFEPLRQELQMVHRRSPYIPFEMKEGLFSVALPSELREAKEVYFLTQKPHVNVKVMLEGFKMASIPRLPVVHKLALQGVPIRRIDRPPFQHRFGPEVDFYLVVDGDEWDQSLRDLSLSFYDSPQFSGLRFYLYWRMI
ncbi:MAG: type VI secretion system baseplate subunit TssK [Desulfobacteraceae bacterium]|nr:type VI secretion system baseplate subunit TssK [Desulfobacteraceae bacterium]